MGRPGDEKMGVWLDSPHCARHPCPAPAPCDEMPTGWRQMQKRGAKCSAATAQSALLFFARLTYGAYRIGLPWRRLPFTGSITGSTTGPTEPHGNQDRRAPDPGTRSGPSTRCCRRHRTTARPPPLAPGPLAGCPVRSAAAGRCGRCRVVPDPPPRRHGAGWWWHGWGCSGHGGRSRGAGGRRAGFHRRAGHGHTGGHRHAAAPGVGGADRGALQRRPGGHQGPADGADRPPAVPAGADAGPGHAPA